MGLDRSELPKERWFPPAAGLETVRALLKSLRAGKVDVERPDAVVRDLEGIQQILVMAEKAKTGFHVAIDI